MIFKHLINITPLNEQRRLHIYLPDHLPANRKVPVLYMFDGHNLFEDEEATYGKSWGLRDYLESTGLPLCVVGLECNHRGNLRLWEFSPYDFSDPEWGEVHGQGEILMDWMSGELKVWVDQHLPVLSDRRYTFIGGSSMGGLMALFAGSCYSSVYSRAACLSPYLTRVMEPLCQDLQTAWIHPDTELYISWGGMETDSQQSLAQVTADNLSVARILQPHAKVDLVCFPEGTHCEACWEDETPVWMEQLQIIDRCWEEEV